VIRHACSPFRRHGPGHEHGKADEYLSQHALHEAHDCVHIIIIIIIIVVVVVVSFAAASEINVPRTRPPPRMLTAMIVPAVQRAEVE
jgi:hypothetical protein